MKNVAWFTCICAVIVVLLLFGIDRHNTIIQIITRIAFPFILGFMYLHTVPRKRINKIYLLVIFFITIGELFLIDPYKYFEYAIYSYGIGHFLFTVIVYKYYLRNESMFDVFTFSLPFFLIFSTIYILYNLDTYWTIQILIIGILACFNASTVLLNYANSRTKQNYLFFMGMFLWLLADAFGGVYRFKQKEMVYYILSLSFDFVAQYLICIAFLLDVKKEEENLIINESY